MSSGVRCQLTVATWPSTARASMTYTTATSSPLVNLQGADLADIDLSPWSNLQGVDFTDADLTGANLRGSGVQSAIFVRAKLNSAILDQTAAQYANFNGADLTAANINHFYAQHASFVGATIVSIRAQTTDLSGPTQICLAQICRMQFWLEPTRAQTWSMPT